MYRNSLTYILQPWIWRQQAPLKRRKHSPYPCSVTTQEQNQQQECKRNADNILSRMRGSVTIKRVLDWVIGFNDISLQLQSMAAYHSLHSLLDHKRLLFHCDEWRMKNHLRLSLSFTLRPTVSWPVCLGIKHPSGAHDQIFITVRQLRVSWCCRLKRLPQFFPQQVEVMLQASVSRQSVLVSSTHFSRLTVSGFLMWGALSDERTGLSFTVYNTFIFHMLWHECLYNIYKTSVTSAGLRYSLCSIGAGPTENTIS
jgi:hypothetical protein